MSFEIDKQKPVSVTKRSIKQRLLRAKISLTETVQKILDINRKKMGIVFLENKVEKEERLQEELKILNKLAAHQAKLIRHYESVLVEQENR